MGTLRLLAKTQMADHLIDAFWKSDFVDRQIREALVRLFGPEPDPALVRLIRVKAPALGPAEIRASLGWLRTTFDFPVVASPTVERPAPEPAARPVRVPPNPSPKVDRTMTGQATSWRHATLGHRVRRLDLRLPLEGKRRGPEFSRRTVPGSRHPADERLDVLAVPRVERSTRESRRPPPAVVRAEGRQPRDRAGRPRRVRARLALVAARQADCRHRQLPDRAPRVRRLGPGAYAGADMPDAGASRKRQIRGRRIRRAI